MLLEAVLELHSGFLWPQWPPQMSLSSRFLSGTTVSHHQWSSPPPVFPNWLQLSSLTTKHLPFPDPPDSGLGTLWPPSPTAGLESRNLKSSLRAFPNPDSCQRTFVFLPVVSQRPPIPPPPDTHTHTHPHPTFLMFASTPRWAIPVLEEDQKLVPTSGEAAWASAGAGSRRVS